MVVSVYANIRQLTYRLAKLGKYYFIHFINRLLTTLFVLSIPLAAHAVPIDANLSITGSVQFDTTNSLSTSGSAVQSGAFSGTFGGVTTSSTINNTTVTGANPLNGNLTDIGDGLRSVLDFGGDTDGENAGMFTDFIIDITNTSLTDQFLITFAVDFTNRVDASGGDAYADSQLSIIDTTNAIEVFFTDLTSDTVNGDMFNGTSPGTFGDALNDSDLATFNITIDPLASINLSGLNSIEGGAFSADGDYSGMLETFLSIVEVTNLTGPQPVPEPDSLLLLGLGLLALVVSRKYVRP